MIVFVTIHLLIEFIHSFIQDLLKAYYVPDVGHPKINKTHVPALRNLESIEKYI